MEMKNHIPTDEQLAAYLSNSCDEAERRTVERYLEENPEALDDLLNMSMAAAVQARHDAGRVKVKKVNFRPAVWAAAASVALILVVGGVWLSRPQMPDGIAELHQPQDTALPAQEEAEMEGNTTQPAPIVEKENEQQQDSHQEPLRVQRTERMTASEATAVPSVEMTFPRRKREVVQAGTDVVFSWTSDATALSLTLTDDEGHLLMRTDVPGKGEYAIPGSKLESIDEFRWTLSTMGGTALRSGNVELVNE